MPALHRFEIVHETAREIGRAKENPLLGRQSFIQMKGIVMLDKLPPGRALRSVGQLEQGNERLVVPLAIVIPALNQIVRRDPHGFLLAPLSAKAPDYGLS